MYLCVHFCLHLCLNFFSISSQFWLQWKPFVFVNEALIFLINHFHLLNCVWKKENIKNCALKGMWMEHNLRLSSYQETLHNMPRWLSECLHHGSGPEYNGVLDVLEGWSGTLLDEEKIYQGEGLGAETVLLKETECHTYLYHCCLCLKTVKKKWKQ